MSQLLSVVSLSAAGKTSWIPVNWKSQSFGIAVAVDLDSAGSLTYSVEHTLDNLYEKIYPASGTHSGTTATINTVAAHDLNVGDWIQVVGGGTLYDGEYSIASVPSTTSFTYTTAGSGATNMTDGAWFNRARVFTHEFLAAATTSDDGNYAFPISAVRLNVTAYTAGKATLIVRQK